MDNSLTKRERLSGKAAIDSLLSKGKFSRTESLRYCCRTETGEGVNRIMISVPKKLFKRAVKRNLLKRRIREAYRTQKQLLGKSGVDLLFTYSTKEILSYEELRTVVSEILSEVNAR